MCDSGEAISVLLAVLRVLLNLTHDNELGGHRLGEQEEALRTVLDIVFLVSGLQAGDVHCEVTAVGTGVFG